MTEAEWGASEDPRAMLEWLARWPTGDPSGGRAAHPRLPSDRKLRLWVEAVRHRTSPSATWANKLDSPAEIHRAAYDSSRSGTGWRDVLPLGDRARLLRDIVATPHRPVTLPAAPRCEAGCPRSGAPSEPDHRLPRVCVGCGHYWESPLLTPTVVSLAHAAYDASDPQAGHLDPLTLAAVADALEEAGCVRQHCTRCVGGVWGEYESGEPIYCDDCPNRCILAHLRSPGPHVCGCWAIDLLTGRE